MLNIKVVSWALATTTLISFVVCVVYGLVTPEIRERLAVPS
jgi:hypothetical protein